MGGFKKFMHIYLRIRFLLSSFKKTVNKSIISCFFHFDKRNFISQLATSVFFRAVLIYLIVFFVLSSCSNLNDPSITTMIYPYSRPYIDNISISNNYLNIRVISTITILEDFEGIILFSSEQSNYKASVDNTNKQGITELTQINHYLTNQRRGVLVSGIFQQITYFSNILFTNTNTHYLSAANWGENITFAKIHRHNGFIFSKLSDPIEFSISKHSNYFLSNANFTSGSNAAIFFNQSTFDVGISESINAVSNLFYFNIENVAGTFIPVFKFLSSNFEVQSLGFRENVFSLTKLPERGYFTNLGYIPVIRGHLYAIRGYQRYFKCYVKSISLISSEISTTNLDIHVNIDFVWPYKTNQRNF